MATQSENATPRPPRPRWRRLVDWILTAPAWTLFGAGAFVVVVVVALAMTSMFRSASAPPPPPEAPQEPLPYRPPGTATLRIYLLPFDDQAASLAQLRELAELLPRQQFEADPGTPVSDLVTREMLAPYASRPRTLTLLGRTATTEDPSEPLGVVPRGGRVFFPALPLVRPSWAGDRTIGASRFRVTDPGGSATFNELLASRLSATESIGTRGHVIDFTLDVLSLARPEVQRLLGRSDVRLVQSPVRVKFGATSACPAPSAPLLTATQIGELQTRIAAATRDVDLFVLDSGWPQAAYDASRARLFALFDRVRGLYELPPATRTQHPFTSPGYDHAGKIMEALKPFTDLDPTGRVKVTYVPMSLAQNSREVLHELLMLGAVIDARAHLLGGRHGALDPSELQNAEMFANTNVAHLPPAPGAVMYTDKFIFDALNRVASEAAREDDKYYLSNYSWVVEAGSMVDTPPAVRRGLGIAAAGNAGTDVSEIDLARRGAQDVHFVTVMNFDEVGEPACDSSFLNETILDHARAVGFSGRLNAISQTSFAAPRVAWLLALAEATRTADPQNLWFQRLQTHLAGARRPEQGFKALAIDAVTLARIWP